jgi:hypothetical protein
MAEFTSLMRPANLDLVAPEKQGLPGQEACILQYWLRPHHASTHGGVSIFGSRNDFGMLATKCRIAKVNLKDEECV